jgi:2-keto-4-pentenoate hydratase/2-oxohepta-3-ene-1,7-dioic acid hydratase in catechol pathway
MQFCRFLARGTTGTQSPALHGVIQGEHVRDISAPPWASWSQGSRTWPISDVRLLAPVEPGKIVCVGRNYAAHAAELGNEVPKEPLIFLKPPSAIIGPGDSVVLPPESERVEHEGELALVVGRRCSRLKERENALSYLLGYTCLNDVTARDLQKKDVQFTRAKGFDTFCPIGPHIETELDPSDVLVEARVNGELRQRARTSLMVYSIAFLVRWISHAMTLEPGDVIATGTPSGVGPLLAGDTAEVSVGGIGVLRNPVQALQS